MISSENGMQIVNNKSTSVRSGYGGQRSKMKPIRDTIITSGEGQVRKIEMYRTAEAEKIEVRDDNERPVKSPGSVGVTFMSSGINSVFDHNHLRP
jgi:hypothetical protein